MLRSARRATFAWMRGKSELSTSLQHNRNSFLHEIHLTRFRSFQGRLHTKVTSFAVSTTHFFNQTSMTAIQNDSPPRSRSNLNSSTCSPRRGLGSLWPLSHVFAHELACLSSHRVAISGLRFSNLLGCLNLSVIVPHGHVEIAADVTNPASLQYTRAAI